MPIELVHVGYVFIYVYTYVGICIHVYIFIYDILIYHHLCRHICYYRLQAMHFGQVFLFKKHLCRAAVLRRQRGGVVKVQMAGTGV